MKRMRSVMVSAVCGLTAACAAGEPAIEQTPDALLDGRLGGVCYSGFRAGQHPDRGDGAVNPSDAEILEDLKILERDTPFRLIRLYDSQENSEAVLRLIDEHGLPFRVVLGAWLEAEVNNPACPWHPKPSTDEALAANKLGNAAEVGRAIRLANAYPGVVAAVAVGNEALVSWNDHMVPEESIAAYVETVKAAVEQPVTVADNYDWWARHGKELAARLDFVSVHIYPVWEGKAIGDGMPYSIECMRRVRETLPHARLVITEAGWASEASEFGERANEANQARYFRELYAWAGEANVTTFFFEAFDESWKGDPNNPAGAEKHWGMWFEDRTPKAVVKDADAAAGGSD